MYKDDEIRLRHILDAAREAVSLGENIGFYIKAAAIFLLRFVKASFSGMKLVRHTKVRPGRRLSSREYYFHLKLGQAF
ncbi:MAG: hypothetical protein ACOC57_01300 [Acidobacteriota bacterium]